VPQPCPITQNSFKFATTRVLEGRSVSSQGTIAFAFVKVHTVLFFGNRMQKFDNAFNEFGTFLRGHISKISQLYLDHGGNPKGTDAETVQIHFKRHYLIALSNCLSLFGYGSSESVLSRAMQDPKSVESIDLDSCVEGGRFERARQLFVETVRIHCEEANKSKVRDPIILSFIHVTLVFMVHISRFPGAVKLLENEFPWSTLVVTLNELSRFYNIDSIIGESSPPCADKTEPPFL
jgi:hypothetical protein